MAGQTVKNLNFLLGKGFVFLLRHRGGISIILIFLLLFCLWGIRNIQFENDIAEMLPENSEAGKVYDTIRHSSMFNKAVLLLKCEKKDIFASESFAQKFDSLAKGIASHSEYIARVDHRLISSKELFDTEKILPYAMLLCKPDILPPAENLPREVMKKLISPLSTGRSRILQSDPAELNGILFRKLNRFRIVSGMNTALDSPWIMSGDRKYVLLTAECKLALSDPKSASILEKILEEEFRKIQMPSMVEKQVILPHKRAEINEKVIKKDVTKAVSLTLLFFGLLTFVFYRGDLRSLLIALLPFPASLLSVGLLVIFFDTPQLFVLGLGGVITGIALDYGIHIYGAMNSMYSYRALWKLLPSLFIGMLTSASAFLVFIFSPMAGVRQLGLFAGSALCFSLFLMLFILPWCLKNKKRIPQIPLQKFHIHLRYRKTTILFFALIAAAAISALPFLKIKSDVRQYDMSPESYDKAEQSITEIFQNNCSPAIALLEGESEENVLEKAAGISHQDIFTLAELLPPEKIRKENLASWKNFDFALYGKKLRQAAVKYGFPENYFDRFLSLLEKNSKENSLRYTPEALANIKKRLLVRGDNKIYYTLVMYRQSPETEKLLRNTADCTIISRDRLPEVMAQDIMKGILPAAVAAIFIVFFLCRLYFRSGTKAFLALLPVLYASIVCAGSYAVCSKGINIPVMAAGIVLCGLGVDYGIFVLHAVAHKKEETIFHSITVSAVTTFAGGLTVAFAESPILHDAGITLMSGIAVIWVVAVILLPCLYSRKKGEGKI